MILSYHCFHDSSVYALECFCYSKHVTELFSSQVLSLLTQVNVKNINY